MNWAPSADKNGGAAAPASKSRDRDRRSTVRGARSSDPSTFPERRTPSCFASRRRYRASAAKGGNVGRRNREDSVENLPAEALAEALFDFAGADAGFARDGDVPQDAQAPFGFRGRVGLPGPSVRQPRPRHAFAARPRQARQAFHGHAPSWPALQKDSRGPAGPLATMNSMPFPSIGEAEFCFSPYRTGRERARVTTWCQPKNKLFRWHVRQTAHGVCLLR